MSDCTRKGGVPEAPARKPSANPCQLAYASILLLYSEQVFRSFYRLRPTRSTLPSFDTVFDLPFDGLRTPLRMLRTGLWASHLVAQADLQRFFEKRCVRKRNPAIL